MAIGELPQLRIIHKPDHKISWKLQFQKDDGTWHVLVCFQTYATAKARMDEMLEHSNIELPRMRFA